MKKILLALLFIFGFASVTYAALPVLNSYQIGSTPVNGYYLSTNGFNSVWKAITSGSGSGTISTSTPVSAVSGLAFWTSTSTLSGTTSPTVGYITATSTHSSVFGGNISASNLSGTNTGDQNLSGLVPYTGATGNVDLGANSLNVGAGMAYQYNGANVITASTTLNNYFFGGAGNLTITGADNVAGGYKALQSNTTGYANIANGSRALQSNTTGYANVANGNAALQANTTGYQNIANGMYALNDNTTGFGNVANGYQALRVNTTGYNNIANGANSLRHNISGVYNIANGTYSLYNNTTGNANIANGNSALFYNTTGGNNIANGSSALLHITTGSNNVAEGISAGGYIADGTTANATSNNSTYLGAYTKALADGDTNETVIGYGATGNGSNSVTIGNDSVLTTVLKGNVGIGTTSPWRTLSVAGTSDLGTNALAGTFTATSTTGTSQFSGNVNVAAQKAYQYNGANVITASTTLDNYFFGGAGNLTMTGSYNIASGYLAFNSNTTGDKNVANGVYALYYNTTGYSNVANGYNALGSNTTGSHNVAEGSGAGEFIADGTTANVTSGTSIYLGANTKALADGDTNEVVIGYNTIGNGTNSVTIGNTSVTKTYLQGDVSATGAITGSNLSGTNTGDQDLSGLVPYTGATGNVDLGTNSLTVGGTLALTPLATPAGSFLAVNASGQVIATSTSAGGVVSVTGTYPVLSTGGANPAISLGFGTTTSNIWSGTQTFTNAPVLSSLGTPAGSFLAVDGAGTVIATTTPSGGGGGSVGGLYGINVETLAANKTLVAGTDYIYQNRSEERRVGKECRSRGAP